MNKQVVQELKFNGFDIVIQEVEGKEYFEVNLFDNSTGTDYVRYPKKGVDLGAYLTKEIKLISKLRGFAPKKAN